jgi:MFS family permease
MDFVGIAFDLGFILGPALGGIFSQVNLLDSFPRLESLGVNPFSVPALIAFVLTLVNLVHIFFRFKETLDPAARSAHEGRSINPLKLFAPLPFKGVNQVNLTYFIFLTSFNKISYPNFLG